jgi:hypothetical protein
VEVVVADDEALDLGSLPFAEVAGRVVHQAQHVAGRGPDVDRGIVAGAEPGAAMGEDHHALDEDLLAALAGQPGGRSAGRRESRAAEEPGGARAWRRAGRSAN